MEPFTLYLYNTYTVQFMLFFLCDIWNSLLSVHMTLVVIRSHDDSIFGRRERPTELLRQHMQLFSL